MHECSAPLWWCCLPLTWLNWEPKAQRWVLLLIKPCQLYLGGLRMDHTLHEHIRCLVRGWWHPTVFEGPHRKPSCRWVGRDKNVSDEICHLAKASIVIFFFRSCQKSQVFTVFATAFSNKFRPIDFARAALSFVCTQTCVLLLNP